MCIRDSHRTCRSSSHSGPSASSARASRTSSAGTPGAGVRLSAGISEYWSVGIRQGLLWQRGDGTPSSRGLNPNVWAGSLRSYRGAVPLHARRSPAHEREDLASPVGLEPTTAIDYV